MSDCPHEWDDCGIDDWWSWICMICGCWGYEDDFEGND